MVAQDILIIGAGWSGVSAAVSLKKRGVSNFKILEARDYIGGRSQTSYLPTSTNGDIPIDLGSAEIHGVIKNPIKKLADDLQVPHAISPRGTHTYDLDGNIVSQGALDKLEESFMSYMRRRQDDDEKDTTLQKGLDDFLKIRSIPKGHSDHLRLQFILDSEICHEYAASLDEMSLFWWDDDSEFDGLEAFMGVAGGGYGKLIEKFAEPITSHVQLQCKVTRIEYGKGGNTKVTYADTSSGDSGASVKEIFAKHVLVTLPLGVLQAGAVKFSPSLPKSKVKAIQKLGNGLLNKCVLHWDGMEDKEIFWPKDQTWISRIAEMGDQGKFTDFHNGYALNGGLPLLVGFVTGTRAFSMEKLSDDEIAGEAISSLRKMFGEDKVPEPTKTMVTRWGSDEFALGGYSFQKLGSTPKHRNDLEKNVQKQLWFAGEATHSQYPQTTHGALLSGEKAAADIWDEMTIAEFEK
mmetsp:Transcript_7827/g.11259  ORF Transcript_7827/g.11259 Transcript_7827/m.11259 type:complete len:463 (-) Transcript_7827:233-1621(-)